MIRISLSIVPFMFSCLNASLVFADTWTVDSTGDSSDATPGDGSCADSGSQCTLRAAIEEANALAGNDTIQFASGVSTIELTLGQLEISGDLVIDGDEGISIARNSGATAFRIFYITSGVTVELTRLSIEQGLTTESDPHGGGIYNMGNLTLTECTVDSNATYGDVDGVDGANGLNGNDGAAGVNRSLAAHGEDGAPGSWGENGDNGEQGGAGGAGEAGENGETGGAGADSGHGGGIYNEGELQITRCTISNNRTSDGGDGANGGNGGIGGNGGDDLDGHRELSATTVPCENEAEGAAYSAVDTSAEADVIYSYYLREYDIGGAVFTYGPIKISTEEWVALVERPDLVVERGDSAEPRVGWDFWLSDNPAALIPEDPGTTNLNDSGKNSGTIGVTEESSTLPKGCSQSTNHGCC